MTGHALRSSVGSDYTACDFRPVRRYLPPLDVLGQALACLARYGIASPETDSDVWSLILEQAPHHPMHAYAICAGHAPESICVSASQYTLSTSPDSLTEADALTMGAIYLRRLFFLHLGRRDALKRVVQETPQHHSPRLDCSLQDQLAVMRRWELAVADVLVLPLPHNTPVEDLQQTFGSIAETTECMTCRSLIIGRTRDVCTAWLGIKRTI